MIEAAAKCEQEFISNLVGKTVSVLFETNKNGICEGYTKNYSRVTVESDTPLDGQIRKVKITNFSLDTCTGILV
jgi:threonylcarbamoyladenosine tRNA methylthiotransferase MtaB